jgi:hypothetical protein
VFSTLTAPSVVVDCQHLANAWNVFRGASASNHVVFVPSDVREVRNLIDATSLADTLRV